MMAKLPVFKINSDAIQLYEVIRITEGIPIFLEDHLDRLYHSAQLTGMKLLPDSDSLVAMIKEYISSQNQAAGNIKLSFSFTNSTFEPQFKLNFIPHYYPNPDEYTNGVKVGLLNAVRPIPHAKVQNSAIRERANQAISDKGLFEVLLIDSKGNITEGSRSNVFFIKNETLYSTPIENILPGITRLKVMQICENAGIHVIESAIPLNSLDQYEAAFLTGTSPKILPISSVDNIIYKTDLHLLVKLQELYDKMIENYLSLKR
ncbi:MAG TPA: aminotransferase class IV [Anaerovoracaceae bacterium]|nr:aminotransferase class IV [Anaerovoracaceae bacterium]